MSLSRNGGKANLSRRLKSLSKSKNNNSKMRHSGTPNRFVYFERTCVTYNGYVLYACLHLRICMCVRTTRFRLCLGSVVFLPVSYANTRPLKLCVCCFFICLQGRPYTKGFFWIFVIFWTLLFACPSVVRILNKLQ